MNIEQVRFIEITVAAQLNQIKSFFQNTENDFQERWAAFLLWSKHSPCGVSRHYDIFDDIICEDLIVYDTKPYYAERGQTVELLDIENDLINALTGDSKFQFHALNRNLDDSEIPQVAEALANAAKEKLMEKATHSVTYDW